MPDVKFFNFHQLSNSEILKVKNGRWKARTDLKFLCNKVLNYKDVCTEVHGPLLSRLQKFPVPDEKQFNEYDDLSKGYIKYRPVMTLEDFAESEKVKRRLILDFRGSLKTTINAMAHTIQWIINYPNTGGLIIQSNIEKAEEILAEIKWHFQYNETFRTLFPEHVPQKKISDWGTKGAMLTEAFDGNNLLLGRPHKEGTLITGGIDKGLAGKHLDFLKFSDIVDPSNSKTATSCFEIAKQYYLCENLLNSPIYWIDVEGTRYSFADLYGKIMEKEGELPEDRRIWSIYIRGCYKKQTKDGEPQKFIPEELKLPDMVDTTLIGPRNPQGKVSWWPKKYPPDDLEHKRYVSPYEFATQMYNNPQSAEDGMKPFPVIEGTLPILIKKKIFEDEIPKSYYEVSVDTAETDHTRSNYTSIAVGCWTGSGMCVIVDIIHGKFLPDVLIDKLYECYMKYRPRNIKIEETSFVRGLMSGIRRKGEVIGVYLPIETIKRENQIGKQERILNTLQPYYKTGQLRFIDGLTAMPQLIKELEQFPTGSQDDILDSITDLFQNKEYFGREIARPQDALLEANSVERVRARRLQSEYLAALPMLTNKFLGISDTDSIPNTLAPSSYNRTGGL